MDLQRDASGNVFDLRKPPEAERKYKPDFDSAHGTKEYKSMYELVMEKSKQIDNPDSWEVNPAYTKWMEKRESYHLASDVMTIRKAYESGFYDPQDPEIARYELRTIGLKERLQSLNQIMSPNNGR